MSHADHSHAGGPRHRSNFPPRPKPAPLVIKLFWVAAIIAALFLGWWAATIIR